VANLVEVFRTPHTAEARIKASLLEDRGLHVTVASPDLAATVGVGTHLIPVRLMVPDPEVDEARAVLAAVAAVADEAPGSGPERCPSCSARWEPGFDVCWSCQYELTADDG